MAFAEDLTIFFNTDDFAEEVTLNGETVSVIFDNPTESVDLYETGVEATDASMLCKTSDLASIARNQTVVRGAASYKTVRWSRIDDGLISRVFLNKV